ncbi:MAG: hypothetical protein WBX17_01705 [Microbacterium sp.]
MAFEPRTMVASATAFGVMNGDIPPADGVDAADHRYRSAVIQHRIARNVHSGLAYRERTLPRFLQDFDGVPGLSLDRQRRVLRGETSATFADLTFWASHFRLVAVNVARYLEVFSAPKPADRDLATATPKPAPATPPLR